MSEQYPSGPTLPVTATPMVAPNGEYRKKGRRNRLPPVPYNENDSTMRAIQERMRERRRRNADLNRSQRGNISNASIMLKLSLRANNRALAKALEEARCETAQDKELIQQLQWSLGVSQQELRQTKQRITDLESEGSDLIEMVSQLQISEEKMRQTVSKIRKVLKDVTEKHLLTIVTQIDDAVLMCNHTRSLSKGSSFFVRSLSDKSDDSRDTFSAPVFDPNEPVRTNIYNKNPVGRQQREVSDIPDDSAEGQPDDGVIAPNPIVDKDSTPKRLSSQKSKRPSSTRKKSRMSSLLDPAELEQALTSETKDPSLITEESEDLFSQENTDYIEKEMELTDLRNAPMPLDTGADCVAGHPEGAPAGGTADAAEGDVAKNGGGDPTKIGEEVMEVPFSQKDGGGGNSGGDQDGAQVAAKAVKAETKKEKSKKRLAKGGKGLKKPSRKLALEKSSKKKNDTALPDASVFDLSTGESFSKPSSPFVSSSEPKFDQNLSTESEKSEPGANFYSMSHSANSDIIQQNESEGTETVVGVIQGEDVDVDDRPLDVQLPQTRRKSRHSSHSKIFKRLTTVLTCDSLPDNPPDSQTAPQSNDREARTCKELGQVLNESSFVVEVDVEGGSVLARKPAFHRKVAGMKKKKRLYDPKKSLDTEVTHASITSDREPVLGAADKREKKSLLKETKAVPKRSAGIESETMNGVLEESWMKDFLNEIDANKEDNQVASEVSQGEKKGASKTFEVGTKQPGTGDLTGHNVGGKIKDQRPIRRGTVCLTNKETSEKSRKPDSGHDIPRNDGNDMECGSVETGEGKERSIRRGTVCLEKRGSPVKTLPGAQRPDEDTESEEELTEHADGESDVVRRLPSKTAGCRTQRGTICLNKGGVSVGASTASDQEDKMEGHLDNDIESDDGTCDRGDIPRDDADRQQNDKPSIRRGTICLNEEIGERAGTVTNDVKLSGGKNHPADDAGLDEDCNEGRIQGMQAGKLTKGKRETRRGTVCLSKDHLQDETKPKVEGSFENGRQQARRGTFAIKTNGTVVGEDGFDEENGEESSDKRMAEAVTKKPTRGKKPSKNRSKRKSEELDCDDSRRSNKRARRKEGDDDLEELDRVKRGNDEEDQEIERVTENWSRKKRSSSLARSKKRFGWKNNERGGRHAKTEDDIEEDETKKTAPAIAKPAGKSSRGRSSSLTRRSGRNVRKVSSKKLNEDGIAADVKEIDEEDEDIELEEKACEVPTRRKSARVSERVFMERGLLKKTVLTERDGILENHLDRDFGEDGILKERDDSLCHEPPTLVKSSSCQEGKDLQGDESLQDVEKVSKEGKVVKKEPRKSKKKAVPSPESEDDDELDDDDPSRYSTKLMKQVDKSRRVGKGAEGKKNANCVVHFDDEGQNDRDDSDDDWQMPAAEKVQKVKGNASKRKKRKISKKSQERKIVDDVTSRVSRDQNAEIVKVVEENGDALVIPFIEEEVVMPEKTQRRPSLQAGIPKERKVNKKGRRKSKKEVALPSESEDDDELDEDLSRYSAKLIKQVDKSRKVRKGNEGKENANCVVHSDDGQDGRDDSDDEWQITATEKVQKVKDDASKQKKRKISKKSQERETADKQEDSERCTPADDVTSRVSGDQNSSTENGRVVEGNGNAPVIPFIEEEEMMPEETQRRPSRQARVKAVKNLKEPSLSKKLRRGDPFTDGRYVSPTLGKKGKPTKKKSKTRMALGDATNVT